MVYTIKINGAYSVSDGENHACHRCILDTPELRREFISRYDPFLFSFDEVASKMDEFAEKKGLRIVDSKPEIAIRDGRYKVDVTYDVEW